MIFVQRLQAFQRAARVLQLRSHLAQLGGQQSRQVSNRQEREQVYEDDRLQRLQPRMVVQYEGTTP